ncbi:MAG: UDP-glucose 4-epimerase [Thermoplasmata archaeon HGW-Thermoplasmata-1]|nr:MAG: UDP-glucose 4-epimerase [Thermoplasmata archaeon HGW-Thermoplasmata-1]
MINLKGKKTVVTGGAGFIGSHLVDRLLSMGCSVVCVDNFSSGRRGFIGHNAENRRFTLIEGDILDRELIDGAVRDAEVMFHLAANPDVKLGASDTYIHLEQNVIATYNVLEAMRKSKRCRTMAFTSTSTVYGEAAEIPTTEGYGPLLPISLYGASKLSCEALVSAYCDNYGMTSVLYRFANVVGPRSTHGVIYDFVGKLNANPQELTILGDGRQRKSYTYVDDVVDAIIFALEKSECRVLPINVGSKDALDVTALADMVCAEMGLSAVYKYTGGVDGGRGWKGDVKNMLLSIDALEKMGFVPAYDSAASIAATVRTLMTD